MKTGIKLSLLVFLLKKKATCLHFCSQIVVIGFVSFCMTDSLQLFHWELFSKELCRRDLLIVQSLCLKVEINSLKPVKNVPICLVHSQKCRILQYSFKNHFQTSFVRAQSEMETMISCYKLEIQNTGLVVFVSSQNSFVMWCDSFASCLWRKNWLKISP